MSSSESETAKKCCVSYVNGHYLVTNNISGTEQKILLVCGYGRSHPRLIPDEISAICFHYFNVDYLHDARVNMIDLGFDKILQSTLVHKDTMYKTLMEDWSSETGIPMEHLAVYYYTERNNGTMRPNEHIVVDLEEKFEGDGDWTDYQIKNHLVPTNPTLETIKSIYQRIGNIIDGKRSFMLLDERRITTVQSPSYWSFFRPLLVALKYFDILEQKMYFVDWLRVKTTTIHEVAKHIETHLIPANKSTGGKLHSLYDLVMKMTEFEAMFGNENQSKFAFFEEEAAVRSQGRRPLFKVRQRRGSESIGCESLVDLNGNIFVFQINPYHPYFYSLKGNNQTNRVNQQRKLPICFQNRKREFEKKYEGYWYNAAHIFLHSLFNMINIDMRIREGTSWKVAANARPHHQWTVDERTTFGIIRKRLGLYYGVKPEHIEIWIPDGSGGGQWNFGSNGRGKWDQRIGVLIQQQPEWRHHCLLLFEIVAYDVRDFEMILQVGVRNIID